MEPELKIHQFTELYSQKPIHFQITEMNKSFMIWVGRPQDGLGDLSIAMPAINKVSGCVFLCVYCLVYDTYAMTLRQNTQPPASNLITQDMSDVSVDLSRRLGKFAFASELSHLA